MALRLISPVDNSDNVNYTSCLYCLYTDFIPDNRGLAHKLEKPSFSILNLLPGQPAKTNVL